MENNCLVTKLNGVVNNDSLEYFDALKIHIKPNASTQYWDHRLCLSTGDAPVIIKTLDGSAKISSTYQGTPANSLVVPANSTNRYSYYVDGDYDILVFGKYKITNLNYQENDTALYNTFDFGDLSQLSYMNLLVSFNFNESDCTGNLSALQNLNLRAVNISSNKVKGDINVFGDMTNMTYLNIAGTKITGSINSLSSLQNLKTLMANNVPGITGDLSTFENLQNIEEISIGTSQITGTVDQAANGKITYMQLYSTSISGSLESLAEAMISKNPTISSTLRVKGNGIITYKVNGVDTVIPNTIIKTITFNGAGGYSIA